MKNLEKKAVDRTVELKQKQKELEERSQNCINEFIEVLKKYNCDTRIDLIQKQVLDKIVFEPVLRIIPLENQQDADNQSK